MNFADEEYVRLYVRDTTSWLMLSWEGRTVLVLTLRKFEKSGVFAFGRHGPERAISVATGLPLEIVQRGLAAIMAESIWEMGEDEIVWRTYGEAQTCGRSDRLRQRDVRARQAADKLSRSASRPVTAGHSSSQSVTARHCSSQDGAADVTPQKPAENPDPVTVGHGSSQPVTAGHNLSPHALPCLTTALPGGGDGQDQSAKVPCPAGLKLSPAQIEVLTGPGSEIPDWAIESIATDWLASNVGRADAPRTLDQWRTTLAKVVSSTWRDRSRRPQKPEPEAPKANDGWVSVCD